MGFLMDIMDIRVLGIYEVLLTRWIKVSWRSRECGLRVGKLSELRHSVTLNRIHRGY